MKKAKDLFKRGVAGTLATSILIASCTDQYNFEDNVYDEFAENYLEKGLALFAETNLSDEFVEHVKYVSSIIDKILTSKEFAAEFSENPDAYLDSFSFKMNPKVAEAEKRMLLAFLDEDIIQAINNKDTKGFLAIAKEKGYLASAFEQDLELIKQIFKSEEEYNKYIESLPPATKITDQRVEWFFGAVCAVVLVAGAVVYVGAATMAGVEIAAAVQAAVYLDVATYGLTTTTTQMNLATKEPILKLWMDNNEPIASTVFYEEIIDARVEELTDMIMANFPTSDRDAVSRILRINIEGYYGIR